MQFTTHFVHPKVQPHFERWCFLSIRKLFQQIITNLKAFEMLRNIVLRDIQKSMHYSGSLVFSKLLQFQCHSKEHYKRLRMVPKSSKFDTYNSICGVFKKVPPSKIVFLKSESTCSGIRAVLLCSRCPDAIKWRCHRMRN